MGAMNFNYTPDKKGGLFEWNEKYTPIDSMIAGHPTQLDGVQLFGMRRGYVTTETTHPFYTRYYDEMKRRLEVSLRAHYSSSLREMVSILNPEGIDYFVFKKADFYAHILPKQTYFPPHDGLMKELTSRPIEQYAYSQLPKRVDMRQYPFMPFKDKYSVIVDIKKLNEYLKSHPE